jgi:DNA mismatch repair protein MutS2
MEPGMRLRYQTWDKPATVLAKDEKRRLVKVDMGGVTIWVKPDELVPETGAKAVPAGASVARTGAGQAAAMTLDLRGYRVEDVAEELARFLDAAILGGLTEVEIIHGRGTGALRREVQTRLKEHRSVARFAPAQEDRGGDGLTVAELR